MLLKLLTHLLIITRQNAKKNSNRLLLRKEWNIQCNECIASLNKQMLTAQITKWTFCRQCI